MTGLRCVRMELGEPDASGRRRPRPIAGSEFEIPCDMVVVAIGTKSNPILTASAPDLAMNEWGYLTTDEYGMTSLPGVFAGGDIVRGAATVILAMGDGKRSAAAIDAYLRGDWPPVGAGRRRTREGRRRPRPRLAGSPGPGSRRGSARRFGRTGAGPPPTRPASQIAATMPTAIATSTPTHRYWRKQGAHRRRSLSVPVTRTLAVPATEASSAALAAANSASVRSPARMEVGEALEFVRKVGPGDPRRAGRHRSMPAEHVADRRIASSEPSGAGRPRAGRARSRSFADRGRSSRT